MVVIEVQRAVLCHCGAVRWGSGWGNASCPASAESPDSVNEQMPSLFSEASLHSLWRCLVKGCYTALGRSLPHTTVMCMAPLPSCGPALSPFATGVALPSARLVVKMSNFCPVAVV